MALRYIGKGTTGDDGKAHLTEDASGGSISPAGYSGSGVGLVDFVASLDKPVSAGSIVSTPYEVWDTVFYDSGILNDPLVNNNWDTPDDFTRESDGTTYVATSWTTRFILVNNSQDITVNGGFIVEFDIVSQSAPNDAVMFTIRDSTNYRNMGIRGAGHYKMVASDKLRMYKGTDTNPLHELEYNTSDVTVKMGFVGSSGSPSMKFKNFKVYYG